MSEKNIKASCDNFQSNVFIFNYFLLFTNLKSTLSFPSLMAGSLGSRGAGREQLQSGRRGPPLLGLELDQGDVLLTEALVTNPLSVNLLGQEVESCLRQPSADAVEPEITS